MSDEHKDLTHLFPPLDILRDNLEDHRANLVGFYVALFYGIETFLADFPQMVVLLAFNHYLLLFVQIGVELL